MTTKGRDYPSRAACRFKGKKGQIVLDQVRTVDQLPLIKKLGQVDKITRTEVLDILQRMFSPWSASEFSVSVSDASQKRRSLSNASAKRR